MLLKLYNRANLIVLFLATFSFLESNLYAFDPPKETYKKFSIYEATKLQNSGEYKLLKQYLQKSKHSKADRDLVNYFYSNISLQKGEYKRAAKEISKAIDLDSTNYWYKVRLAKIYSTIGDFKSSISVYEALKDKYPQKSELYEEMVDLYLRTNEFEKALGILSDIEKSSGKYEGLILMKLNLLSRLNRESEAIEQLVEFNKETPSARSSAILGDIYGSKQKDTLALTYYNQSLSIDPFFSAARFGCAEIYRFRRQYDLYFENIVPFLADSTADPKMKADYLKEIKKNTQFVQAFLPQVDTMISYAYMAHPKDTSLAYEYSYLLVQLGRDSAGLEVLRRNIISNPNYKSSYTQYLSLLYFLKNWKEMTSIGESVLKKFPGDIDLMEMTGVSYIQQNQSSKAIEIYKNIYKSAKSDTAYRISALSVLGDLNYQNGQKKEAFKYYRKTLLLNPKSAPTLNNYAYYLSLDKKSLSKALDMSSKSLEIEPDNSTYLDTYAWILYNLGRYEEARNIFKKAMVYGGRESADILDHYAETLFALKEYDLAFLNWEKAHTIDPSMGIDKKIELRKKEKR